MPAPIVVPSAAPRNKVPSLPPVSEAPLAAEEGSRLKSEQESDFVSLEQASRKTVGGLFLIHEIDPGNQYEVRLDDHVVFRTELASVIENPPKHREVPGIIPHIIADFLSVRPFDEVLVLRWFDYGNLCATHGFSFVGIRRDGTFRVTSLPTCTDQEALLDSDTKGIRLILPPEPPGERHGSMNPLIPGDEWIFQDGKLRRTRKIYQLLPFQKVAE